MSQMMKMTLRKHQMNWISHNVTIYHISLKEILIIPDLPTTYISIYHYN
jgi:hypothetical protein